MLLQNATKFCYKLYQNAAVLTKCFDRRLIKIIQSSAETMQKQHMY